MHKKSILKGAAILTAANLITRLMGFFYRINMSEAIGAEGMGLYQLVMPIYLLSWSITSSGFSTTISRLSASENAWGNSCNIKKVVRISVFLCLIISMITALFMFFGADFLANEIIQDSRTAIALKILAFAIPFMAVGSCIRGYFLGMQHQGVPAISQVLEQTVRILSIFVLGQGVIGKGLEYACAAAVVGVLLGEAVSCIFTIISYRGFSKFQNSFNPTYGNLNCMKMILSMAIPLSLTRISSSLLATVENILIPQKLQAFGETETIAMSIYGNLTGMAIPLIQLPSAILFAVATALMPTITELSTVGNKKKISETVSLTIMFTSIAGIGISCLFAVFPHEITSLVYNRYELGDLLFKLVPACPFLYMQIVFWGILNGLGEHMFIFKNNIIASVINIFFIFYFVPKYGSDAYIAGWCISLIVTVLLSTHKIVKRIQTRIRFITWILKPAISAVLAGIAARALLFYLSPSRLIYLLTLIFMFLMYLIFLIMTGAIKKSDFKIFKI